MPLLKMALTTLQFPGDEYQMLSPWNWRVVSATFKNGIYSHISQVINIDNFPKAIIIFIFIT